MGHVKQRLIKVRCKECDLNCERFYISYVTYCFVASVMSKELVIVCH